MKTKVLYTVIVYPNKDSRQVIACHPRHGTNHYRNIVIAAMQDLTTIDEDRISITRDKFTVHLVFGELWYACLTPIEGSPVAASEVSLEVQEFLGHVRSVYRELPILADLSRELPNSSAGDLSRPLGKILERYGQETIINLTPKVHQELQDIRTILLDSMQRLIDRGERLDELVKKAQTLEISVRKDFRFTPKIAKDQKNCFGVFSSAVLLISTLAFAILLYIEIFS
ncbi:uncharacterized protein [Fopius arisanus]|uniref:V-SNARE coiled-coil homology domain-containing protein n=1 Tax=Fopius arisanus TaxID=64838 RepID=A0A9R1U128_9HYME|nr:PREDICTED: uncharacterized protein LOC105266712 [Fopius arisanus]